MHQTYNHPQLYNSYDINNRKFDSGNGVRIILISYNDLSSNHCCKSNTNI